MGGNTAAVNDVGQDQNQDDPWGSAGWPKTEQDILDDKATCLEEGGDDPAFIVHALGVAARARNMSQLARDTGLSREGLYKALSGEGNPSFAPVLKAASTRCSG